MASKQSSRRSQEPEVVAGNGLLDRRALLGRGLMFAGAMGTGVGGSLTGAVIQPYQTASRFEKNVVRTVDNPDNVPRNSRARTPHQLLNGIITPNGLHFTICHGGVPDIDPDQHKLVIHGLVKRPLEFSLEAL